MSISIGNTTITSTVASMTEESITFKYQLYSTLLIAMDIRVVISNIAAATILILFSTALVTGSIPESSEALANMMIGASITYLFTENVVNGSARKPEVIDV